MADVSRQTQMTMQEILAAIGQLGPVDLEKVARHVTHLRMRRVTGQETELLKTARCRRPRAFDRRYHELMRKRQEETLTEAEYEELLRLTGEAEEFDTRRIKALSALADLRQTDLDTLMRELNNIAGVGAKLMVVTTFQGTVQNGQVRLADDVILPENTKVFVVVPDLEPAPKVRKFDLAEMVSRMPQDYQVHEESFGKPVGKEEW